MNKPIENGIFFGRPRKRSVIIRLIFYYIEGYICNRFSAKKSNILFFTVKRRRLGDFFRQRGRAVQKNRGGPKPAPHRVPVLFY